MRHIIEKLRHQTRWRVYACVLPVVFLAVMLVGVFGWHVFNRYGLESLVRQESKEVAFLLDNLRQKTLIEALGLEAHKDETLLESAGPAAADSAGPFFWMQDLLRSNYLLGIAVAGTDVAGGAAAALCLADSVGGAVNTLRIEAWLEDNRTCLGGSGGNLPAVPDGHEYPVMAHRDRSHPIYVFSPILLEKFAGQPQYSAGGELAALLPVLVREDDRQQTNRHTIYFLSLNRMLLDLLGEGGLIADSNVWWCLINQQGRVIDAAGGLPVVGSLLRNQHRTKDDNPFRIVSGEELVGGWELGKVWENPLVGWPLAQWVVTAGQSAGFPVAILVGHPTDALRAASLGYVLAVLGVALLALALAFFGISRIIGRISGRVGNLARNLELVAQGDYTRRIPADGADEVGRLITYFNRMASSLDETQGQLVEKTQHLETALENRQMLDRAKDDFLVLISHEVRTPLTSIMGGVELLKGIVKRTTDEERELLARMNIVEVVDIIESSGARLHGFMNDAIQMTSIQSSDKELNLQPESIGSLVELGLCGLREVAQMRGIEVVNGLEVVQDWLVLCDARVLKLAFQKILKNAVMHNYDQGRVVIREVQEVPGHGLVAELPRPEDIHRLHAQESFTPYRDLPLSWRIIEVFNTGDTIPVERCAALFAKFELVGRIEHHQRGSGLSLPIAQSAVEYHGGRVFVNSVKLQGNSFYLLLPTIAAAHVKPGKSRPPVSTDAVIEQMNDGLGGGAGDKKVGQTADCGALEVELHH